MTTQKNGQDSLAKDSYFGSYVNLIGFISYYYQIALILENKPKKLLEIGCGNKIVSNYLKESGIKVTTCDFNANLEPDIVADIRSLPCEEESYDVVTAFEVLEHLPWDEVDKGLSEMKRVTKKTVIISLPYPSFFKCEVVLNNRTLSNLFGKQFLSFLFRIPPFLKKHTFNGHHYWEIGKKGYSLNTVKKKLQQHFKLIKIVRPPLNPYHYFFILEKR